MIIGTAGHIDHGKTALVHALTGVETDRLKEEKARGITIDLGFAYHDIGDGKVLGFVDVPGHDRFIRNMLAGATGIDFVLLVVAADDGVMPQTREHLSIMHLLGLSRGVVALTKCDLVSDERCAEVAAEITETLRGTLLENAAILPVSTVTSEGISTLKELLADQLETFAPEGSNNLFRLSVDRCFSLRGAGTIVTGAVVSGSVRVGDKIVISPKGLSARVRAIHAQNQSVTEGHMGQRCALNLVGERIGVKDISRGDYVLDAGVHAPTSALDGELIVLASEPRPLRHWTPVRLHHGAAEISARLALLQNEDIQPGETGLVQLVLENLTAACVGDRFVIRDTSGARTMGGGRLIDLRGPRRRRRIKRRLAQIRALVLPDPADCLKALLSTAPFVVDIAQFARDRAMGALGLNAVLEQVPHSRLRHGNHDLMFSKQVWNSLTESAVSTLETFHQKRPQVSGAGAAWLAKTLEPRQTARIGAVIIRQLVNEGTLASKGGAIRLPNHRPMLDTRDQRIWQRILPHLSGDNRFRPAHGRECAALLDERETEVQRVLNYLAKQDEVIELARDRFFLIETLREIAEIVAEISTAMEDGWFPAAALRDRLDNGRKVSIEILEYFDRNGLTTRQGDLRRIVPQKITAYINAPSDEASTMAIVEENRSRWNVRTSTPGGAVSQS